MLRTNWYNYFRNTLKAIEFARIAYWAPKEQNYQLSSKKGSQGGPKSENQLYLNNYDSCKAQKLANV